MGRYVVRTVAVLAAIGTLAACEGDAGPVGPAGPEGPPGAGGPQGPAGPSGIENFTASMNGANVVGGTGSAATGTASFSVVGQTLLYNIDVTGIVAGLNEVTTVHIHGPASVGVNTGVIQGLCNSDDGPACRTGTIDGVLVAGAATRSRIPIDSLVVLLRNGNAYVNVHTTAFPGGEIRGQVGPT